MEATILKYIPEKEKGHERREWYGSAQYALLSAIPVELRSCKAKRRFQELKRKFGGSPKKPVELDAHRVESPISQDEAAKMSDGQWLKAIARYSSGETREAVGGLVGGVQELSRVLGDCVEKEPERFVQLALRFERGSNPAYLQHVLIGLCKVELNDELKLDVCRKAYDESREIYGSQLADTMGSFSEPLSEEVVSMLTWLATKHSDPDQEQWECETSSGTRYWNGDVYTNGINTVRGRAAIAMMKLIHSDFHALTWFKSTLDQMLRDSSSAVLSCVAGILEVIAIANSEEASLLFLKMNVPSDRLLSTPHVRNLVKILLEEHFHEIEPVIERMISSSEKDVAEMGAMFAGLAILMKQAGERHVDRAMNLTAAHRLGIAKVAARNVQIQECRTWCETYLLRFFDDESADVRREAASCFRHLENEPLDEYENLIDRFSLSQAFADDSSSIFDLLEQSRRRLPGITCRVCDQFLLRFSEEARDFSRRRALDTSKLSKIVFRTYQQHQNDEWASRTLDLIDRLCAEKLYGTDEQFELYER